MTKLIALDNGHGINTGGKRTPAFPDGTRSTLTGKLFMHEWEYNRAVVLYLDVELKRCGFKTIQVSPTDVDTSITLRATRARNANADLLVSIHANAHTGQWGSANGIETLTCGVESTRIGRIIQKELIDELKLRDRGLKDGCWLGLVRNSGKIPVVLVEGGFMDNLVEAKLLLSEDYRKRTAVAIAKGICKAYNVKYVEEVIDVQMGKVYLDGKLIGECVLHDGRSWLPVRALEGKKYKVDRWDGNTKSVYLVSIK